MLQYGASGRKWLSKNDRALRYILHANHALYPVLCSSDSNADPYTNGYTNTDRNANPDS